MAKYDVNFSCGHNERIELFGKIKERERKIEWYEKSGLCSECYRKQKEQAREEQNKLAEEKSKELGLPELQGSEKQIAWANTIRQKMFNESEKLKAEYIGKFKKKSDDIQKLEEYIKQYETIADSIFQKIDSAKWYIENREKPFFQIFREQVIFIAQNSKRE